MYGWEQFKKKMMKMANSTVLYLALLRQQRLSRQSLLRSFDMYYGIHGLERVGCAHPTYIYT